MPHPALPTPAPGRVLPGLIPLTGFSWNVSCTGRGQHRGEGWIELLALGWSRAQGHRKVTQDSSSFGEQEPGCGHSFLCGPLYVHHLGSHG